jgi:hypothetical protein
MAAFVRKLLGKKQRKVGGDMVNFSLFLSGEYKPAADYSIQTMLVDSVVDTSGSNLYSVVACGYGPGLDLQDRATYTNQPVKFSIRKIKSKGDLFEGTYVVEEQPAKKKIKGVDKATFLVNP